MNDYEQVIKLLPSQARFHAAEDDVLCEIGGRGTGKTEFNLALWTLKQCMDFPNNQGVVCSSGLPQLRQSTVPGLLKTFDLCGVAYKYNEWQSSLYFENGSWFRFQPLNSVPEDEIKGSNLGFIGCDEVDACPEGHLEKLMGGLRRPGTAEQVRLVGNSPPPGHWLEKWFIPEVAAKFHREVMGPLLQSKTYDNHFLSEKFIRRCERMWPVGSVKWRRFMMGEMRVPLEGAVYEDFRQGLVVKRNQVPWDRISGYVHGLDFGYSKPTAFLKGAVTDDDHIYIVGEHYKARWLLAQHAGKIHSMYEGGAVAADHDSQDCAELAEMGIDTIPANKSVIVGIDSVNLRLREGTLHFVDGACPNLLGEIPNYVWNDAAKKDEPVKANDHACDALRYLVCAHDRPEDELY